MPLWFSCYKRTKKFGALGSYAIVCGVKIGHTLALVCFIRVFDIGEEERRVHSGDNMTDVDLKEVFKASPGQT